MSVGNLEVEHEHLLQLPHVLLTAQVLRARGDGNEVNAREEEGGRLKMLLLQRHDVPARGHEAEGAKPLDLPALDLASQHALGDPPPDVAHVLPALQHAGVGLCFPLPARRDHNLERRVVNVQAEAAGPVKLEHDALPAVHHALADDAGLVLGNEGALVHLHDRLEGDHHPPAPPPVRAAPAVEPQPLHRCRRDG
eukprot:760639-Hanusia_phi.AAC.2